MANKPYIVKFYYYDETSKDQEEMFLCLHAEDRRDAREKYAQVTGGESRNCFLTSVTGPDKIEAFWNRSTWSFVTIPTD